MTIPNPCSQWKPLLPIDPPRLSISPTQGAGHYEFPSKERLPISQEEYAADPHVAEVSEGVAYF